MNSIEITLEACKGLLKRKFEKVLDVKESEHNIFVVYEDENGEKLKTTLSRDRFVFADQIPEIGDGHLGNADGLKKYKELHESNMELREKNEDLEERIAELRKAIGFEGV